MVQPKSQIILLKKSLKELFADITLSKTLEICHASTLGYFLPKTPCARVFPKTSFESI